MNNNQWHERFHYFLLICIVILYPFSLKLCNLSIFIFAIHWLLWVLRKPKDFNWRSPIMWLMISYYAVCLFSVLYSANIKVAVFALDKKVVMLLLPLILGTMPKMTAKQFERLFFIASGSVTIALLICLAAAIYRHFNGIEGGFFWKSLTQPFGDYHPTYLSLYINFLIAWLLIYLIENWNSKTTTTKVIILGSILFFYFSLGLLSSKIELILSAIVPFIISIRYASTVNLKIIIPAYLLTLFLSIILLINSEAWERFSHINRFSYQLDAPVSAYNEFTIRLAITDCSWQIIKNNLIFGVGIGDVYDELDKVYRKVDYKFGYLDQQNPHSEYLSQWLGTGLIGLCLLILIMVVQSYKAIKNNQFELLMLIFLLAITFSFESVLERQKGIVFFSLFISLYSFHSSNKKKIVK